MSEATIDIVRAVARDYQAAGYAVRWSLGWETHGRPYARLVPRGGVAHHTATGTNWSWQATTKLLRDGRSDLPGPLSQFGLDRDGTLDVIAAETSNHAGPGGWRGLKGNQSVWGIEAYNNGVGEAWPQRQLDGYVLLARLLGRHSGFGADMWSMHREWSTYKIDPKGIDGYWFRAQVGQDHQPAAGKTCESQVFGLGDEHDCVSIIQRLLNKRGNKLTDDGDFGPRTDAAVKRFQRKVGLTPDGVVGPQTWAGLWKGISL